MPELRPTRPARPIRPTRPAPGVRLPADVISSRARSVVEEVIGRIPRPAPLRSGDLAAAVEIPGGRVADLVRTALAPDPAQASVVWTDGGDEVVAHLGRSRVEVVDGKLLVAVPLETDEAGLVELTAAFAFGSQDQPTGLLAAAERLPRGDPRMAQRWGEAVLAAVWSALLDVAQEVAGAMGTDQRGERLLPGALVARGGVLAVVPQARHEAVRKVER